MHYHPETLFVLHNERQARLELEAARYSLIASLRRRHRRWWRRPARLKPVPVALRPLLR
jgi:hypothetical protein